MNIFTSIISILFMSFIEMLYLAGAFIAVGLILGVMEKLSNKFFVRAYGPKGILWTAWIGTPVHELGHLLMCFLWGHRVTRVKLLQTRSMDGTLGFVEHQYNPGSIYQQIGNFFIGLGPIFSGIGALILGMYFLVPDSYYTFTAQVRQHVSFERLDLNVLKAIGNSVAAICRSLFTVQNLVNPLFWIFLVIAISISSHIALSRADMEGSAKGLEMIYILLVIINIAAHYLQFDSYRLISRIAQYNAYCLAFSSVAILFSFLTLVIGACHHPKFVGFCRRLAGFKRK